MCNTQIVPEKEGAGFSSLTTQKRTDRAMRFFYVCTSSCASMGGGGGEGFGLAGFFCVQSTNPTICRPPHLVVGRGLTTQEDYTMTSHASTTPNSNNPSPAGRSNSPISALTKLDGYMVVAGYGDDHPWRTEIARALVAPAPTDAAFYHALDAVDAANLAVEIIGDLETFLCTIDALAKSDEATEAGARAQLCAIQNIARLAVHFADDRRQQYSFVQDDATKALATLDAVALASLDAAA